MTELGPICLYGLNGLRKRRVERRDEWRGRGRGGAEKERETDIEKEIGRSREIQEEKRRERDGREGMRDGGEAKE